MHMFYGYLMKSLMGFNCDANEHAKGIKQYKSIDQMKNSFFKTEYVGLKFKIVGLTNAKKYNDREGTVTKVTKENKVLVELHGGGEKFKIKIKNLQWIPHFSDDVFFDVDKKEYLNKIKMLLSTPEGRKFDLSILSNAGFLQWTSPENISIFKQLVTLKVGSTAMQSDVQQQLFENVIRLTKMNKYKQFCKIYAKRKKIQFLPSGEINLQAVMEYELAINSDKDLLYLKKKAYEYGILKARRRIL
eukprot:g13110.t1